MTKIIIETAERIERVTVKGHAGYADAGEDIVCAGISTLTFAAGIALERYNLPAKINQDELQAEFVIIPEWAQMTKEEVIRAETILFSLVWALEDLANSYAKYVKLDKVRR